MNRTLSEFERINSRFYALIKEHDLENKDPVLAGRIKELALLLEINTKKAEEIFKLLLK